MWGTDSVWYGSPQWQIEAMRRLEIHEHMQKKYGFAPLGDANSATKQMIFGTNAARLYRLNLKAAGSTPMPASTRRNVHLSRFGLGINGVGRVSEVSDRRGR